MNLHLQRFVTVIGLGVGLVAFSGGALAQQTAAPTINANGSSGRSDAGTNPAVDADGPTLVYGDIPGGTVIGPPKEGSAPVASDVVYAPPPGTSGDITATDGNAATMGPGDASAAPGTVTGGSGTALLGPDGTYSVTDAPPSNVTVGESGAPVPAPVSEPVPVVTSDTPVEEAVVDSTVADSDGDGVADADEVNIYGTDASVWDTDGDGVSDGDELFVYNTDALVWDTDGDGVGDGDEVLTFGTDPLVWDTNGDAVSNGGGEIAGTELAVEQGAASNASVLDSDNDRLADADEAAIGTDANNPDSDGDGYYDGDEANLGTDPLDATSFPTGEQTV